MRLQLIAKGIYLLTFALASAQLMGCAPQEFHNSSGFVVNNSASSESIASSEELIANKYTSHKEVHFSDFVDTNSITPIFDFIENEVWFLAINDSGGKSLRYSIDKEYIVSEMIFEPGTRASNDPRTGIETVINDIGEVSFAEEKLQLPDYSNATPASLSPFGNTIAYTNSEKNVLMVYDLAGKKMKHTYAIDMPNNKSAFFYSYIEFLNERNIFLSLLDDKNKNAVAVIDVSTGNVTFTMEGAYSVSPINENEVLLRPSLGDSVNNDLYLLTLNGENITRHKIEKITNNTEKMTIRYSHNGKFAVTNKAEDENIIFTVYETKNFSTINQIILDNTQGQYDCILNGDYQQISNNGENLLILDNQWKVILLQNLSPTN